MNCWQVIIEGETSGKRFLRTASVSAENSKVAQEIAKAAFERDGDRFIEVSEVTGETAEAQRPGLIYISGRIFFD